MPTDKYLRLIISSFLVWWHSSSWSNHKLTKQESWLTQGNPAKFQQKKNYHFYSLWNRHLTIWRKLINCYTKLDSVVIALFMWKQKDWDEVKRLILNLWWAWAAQKAAGHLYGGYYESSQCCHSHQLKANFLMQRHRAIGCQIAIDLFPINTGGVVNILTTRR